MKNRRNFIKFPLPAVLAANLGWGHSLPASVQQPAQFLRVSYDPTRERRQENCEGVLGDLRQDHTLTKNAPQVL
ncbi:MAG: hypothetical protein JSR23_01055 [Proteobacteria bacterium]|nr:hypothetical protein [Pseudomonadota bacterium]